MNNVLLVSIFAYNSVFIRHYSIHRIASEAVKWLQEHLNVTKEEAIALGRGLELEGFIHHVTYRYNFADSPNLYFRFAVR